jgi:hypothetical protein
VEDGKTTEVEGVCKECSTGACIDNVHAEKCSQCKYYLCKNHAHSHQATKHPTVSLEICFPALVKKYGVEKLVKQTPFQP